MPLTMTLTQKMNGMDKGIETVCIDGERDQGKMMYLLKSVILGTKAFETIFCTC